MAIARKNRYKDDLVDLAAGQISREIFVNEEIYQEEQERVFTRAWLFVGHESQIPKPGDYFVSWMGEESVILCRNRDDRVNVFLNSRRHRGMKTRPRCWSTSFYYIPAPGALASYEAA